jgi:lysophospholipid hydrolase
MIEGFQGVLSIKWTRAASCCRRVELVLLHDSDADPKGTLAWLQPRPQLQRHHHIRLANDKVAHTPCRADVCNCCQSPMQTCEYCIVAVATVASCRGHCTAQCLGPPQEWCARHHAILAGCTPEHCPCCAQDMARLGRWMAGKAVGLVLSGGGSRGLAHLGVLHALDTAGVPVDVIGGTSQVPYDANWFLQACCAACGRRLQHADQVCRQVCNLPTAAGLK